MEYLSSAFKILSNIALLPSIYKCYKLGDDINSYSLSLGYAMLTLSEMPIDEEDKKESICTQLMDLTRRSSLGFLIIPFLARYEELHYPSIALYAIISATIFRFSNIISSYSRTLSNTTYTLSKGICFYVISELVA